MSMAIARYSPWPRHVEEVCRAPHGGAEGGEEPGPSPVIRLPLDAPLCEAIAHEVAAGQGAAGQEESPEGHGDPMTSPSPVRSLRS